MRKSALLAVAAALVLNGCDGGNDAASDKMQAEGGSTQASEKSGNFPEKVALLADCNAWFMHASGAAEERGDSEAERAFATLGITTQKLLEKEASKYGIESADTEIRTSSTYKVLVNIFERAENNTAAESDLSLAKGLKDSCQNYLDKVSPSDLK